MSSIKVFLKSGAGVAASAIFGVGLIKIIAVKSGPEGVGEFGLYRQFFQILTVLFTLGNGYSIIEGVSKATDKKKFLQLASDYVLIISLILSLLILSFSEQLSQAVFSSQKHVTLIRMTPLFILTMAYHNLMKSALSGEGKIGRSGIATSLPFLAMFLIAIISTELIDLYLYSSVGSLLLCLWLYKKVTSLVPTKEFHRLKNFESTSLSTIITGVVGFLSFLVVKAIATHRLGINQTGLLEASWSLVSYTTLVFLTSLGVYYLPKISREHDSQFRNKYFIIINGLGVLSLTILYLLNEVFISLLFTKEFMLMNKLLLLMAFGEYLKCLNWFFIFSMIGLSYKKAYVILDVIANIFFVAAVYFSDFSNIDYIGGCYIAFQGLYFIGNLLFNLKLKIIPMGLTILNLAIGIALWGLTAGIKQYAG